MGGVKSELFHYEVRAPYVTPDVADSRRIVTDAIQQSDQGNPWHEKGQREDEGDAPEW